MKKILVVIDVQNDFVTDALRNEEAIKAIPNIVKKIRNFNGDYIFVTQDTHEEDYLTTKEGEKLPVKHCIKDTTGWEIEPSVQSALNDARFSNNIPVFYVEKPTFGSFDLLYKMQAVMEEDEEIEIELCGFCTDICTASNALMIKAAFYKFGTITVDASCCAGVTPEAHKAALDVMRSCQINVIND